VVVRKGKKWWLMAAGREKANMWHGRGNSGGSWPHALPPLVQVVQVGFKRFKDLLGEVKGLKSTVVNWALPSSPWRVYLKPTFTESLQGRGCGVRLIVFEILRFLWFFSVEVGILSPLLLRHPCRSNL